MKTRRLRAVCCSCISAISFAGCTHVSEPPYPASWGALPASSAIKCKPLEGDYAYFGEVIGDEYHRSTVSFNQTLFNRPPPAGTPSKVRVDHAPGASHIQVTVYDLDGKTIIDSYRDPLACQDGWYVSHHTNEGYADGVWVKTEYAQGMTVTGNGSLVKNRTITSVSFDLFGYGSRKKVIWYRFEQGEN